MSSKHLNCSLNCMCEGNTATYQDLEPTQVYTCVGSTLDSGLVSEVSASSLQLYSKSSACAQGHFFQG